MNRFICALWNEGAAKSQKGGKEPSTVRNSHCCSEIHASWKLIGLQNKKGTPG